MIDDPKNTSGLSAPESALAGARPADETPQTAGDESPVDAVEIDAADIDAADAAAGETVEPAASDAAESAADEDADALAAAADVQAAAADVEEQEEGHEESEAVGEDPEIAESAAEDSAADDDETSMDWYILKVQSNRERSIADGLRRKIAIEGLDEYFGEVIVPTEKVTEFKGGKKKVVERKLYPGYIVVHMHINDDTWFAVRETSGIGDFTGAGGKPTPMLPHEVARIVQTEEEETDEAPKLDIKFQPGDGVKVKEGTFEGFEGEVNEIDPQSGKVKVLINIFGRSTPVELEYWQVESA